jgi:hypothetical protein
MNTTFIKKILGGFIKMNDQVDIKIIISCMRWYASLSIIFHNSIISMKTSFWGSCFNYIYVFFLLYSEISNDDIGRNCTQGIVIYKVINPCQGPMATWNGSRDPPITAKGQPFLKRMRSYLYDQIWLDLCTSNKNFKKIIQNDNQLTFSNMLDFLNYHFSLSLIREKKFTIKKKT